MLLNDQITNKAKQTREEALEFEDSLALEFESLQAKSNENIIKVNDQIELLNKTSKLENGIANKVGVIAAMFSKNALLENLYYAKVEEKLSKFPKKTQEQLATPPPPPTPPQQTQPPKKMAAGGATLGNTGQKEKDKKIIPYEEILTLPLKASGIASLTVLGDFIKGTGSLGGFFAPYVQTMVKPFALALGVSGNIINTLIGGSVQAATLDLKTQQRDFGKTWGKFLGDETFIQQFIDRVLDPNRPPGYVPAKWDQDPEFVDAVNKFAEEYQLSAPGLLALMARESGLRPDAENSSSHAVGLIQITNPSGVGSTKEDLKKMTRAEQMPYVIKYLENAGVKKGMTPADIYALVFLPGRYADRASGAYGSPERMGTILTVSGEAYYDANIGLDDNSDGKITLYDLEEELKKSAKAFKIQGFEIGGVQKAPMFGSVPYMMSGSEGGYDAFIQGMPVTLHGAEIVVPSAGGFQVYPIKNRKYNIFEDPIGVAKRWKEIAQGANTQNVTSFSSGGSSDFWKVAALTSKEDSLHPQGQADVAQALYNRAAIGSYPGGRSLGSIVTAPGQFEPTFHNAGAWAGIRDRKSAIAATGSASKLDMAAKSITNPSLQKEAQRFVGGRTDFMGESQKPNMKPGDVTRGPGYNFHGWFYDAKLPKAAPVPQMIASQMRTVASSNRVQPKVIVNKIGSSSSPNIIQQTQRAMVQITNMIFNPHKVKKEIILKRV